MDWEGDYKVLGSQKRSPAEAYTDRSTVRRRRTSCFSYTDLLILIAYFSCHLISISAGLCVDALETRILCCYYTLKSALASSLSLEQARWN